MDVGGGAERFLLVLGGFVVVDDQCDCPDVDAAADGLRAQQHLDLLVPQLGYPRSFGGRTVLRVDVVLAHLADRSALAVYVIHVDVILARIGGPLVIDHELAALVLQREVELPELWDGVEEDDDLRLRFDLRQLL